MKKVVFMVLALSSSVLLVVGATSCSNKSAASQVEFVVTGSAPAGVVISFGDDTSTTEGHFPVDVTQPITQGAQYEDVTAQLQGGGKIRCTVIIGDTVNSGSAEGGYHICSARLKRDATNGGWH